jgi:hypothetical protein
MYSFSQNMDSDAATYGVKNSQFPKDFENLGREILENNDERKESHENSNEIDLPRSRDVRPCLLYAFSNG